MTIPLFEPRASHPQDRAAWLASVAVHACLFAGLAYLSWSTLGGNRIASVEPASEFGVVIGFADDPEAPAGEMPSVAANSSLNGSARDAEASNQIGDSLVSAGAMQPVPGSGDSQQSLVAAPRLPRLALGESLATAAVAGSSPSANEPRRGPLRIAPLVERATVTVFGAVGEGSKFVYLFDHSTSMTGAPLAAAKQQLIGSLDALDRVHQFQIMFFNHEVDAWDLTGGQGRIPFASEANKRLAAQFVSGVVAAGATDRLTPLRRALAMNPDVIFFLTDADDAMPDYDVAEVVERARSRGAKIACIEFGDGPAASTNNFLTQIAAQTGGDYVYVDAAQLGDFLNR